MSKNSCENGLIQTINAFVHKSDLPTNCNWIETFSLAKRHSVGSLFYMAIKYSESVPQEVKKAASQNFFSQTAQQISQEYYAEEIFAQFKEKKIKYMPLKGYYMRKVYPMPEVRTSCDVDIYFDKVRKEEVDAILKGLGFELDIAGLNQDHWGQGAIAIETHFELEMKRECYRKYYENVWDRLKTEDGIQHNFSDEDFYIYSIVHAAKHFRSGGFGIRTVLDVYYYRKNVKMNEQYLSEEFAKLGLKKFVDCIENLADVWFDGKQTDEQTEILANYILESATYGTSNTGIAMKNVGKNSVKKAKRKYLFRAIFPKFSSMKILFPVLERAPILLPFLHVYRWLKVLFIKRDKIKRTTNTIKEINQSNYDKVNKVLEITEIPQDEDIGIE